MTRFEKLQNKLNDFVSDHPIWTFLIVVGIPFILGSTSYYLFYLLLSILLIFGMGGLFFYKVIYKKIRHKIEHKKRYQESKRYRRNWDASEKRKEKERQFKLKKMSILERIGGIIGNFFGYILITCMIIALSVVGLSMGGTYIPDLPYYIFHQYETKTGIIKGEEIRSPRKNIPYKLIYIDDLTLTAETDMEFKEGEKVTVKYLPYTKLIMKISE
ncbi:hypothetical protein [Neobacillus sp. LXY-4]|uniref:hypothetical protein n=1 Tax=Neobacillus sp. LXY-4 TaxID=3379826 RepID=UPI003EE1CF68